MNLEQQNPDLNKHEVQRLFAERDPHGPTVFAAPLRGGWAIWRTEKKFIACGDTPAEAWAAALELVKKLPAPTRRKRHPEKDLLRAKKLAHSKELMERWPPVNNDWTDHKPWGSGAL